MARGSKKAATEKGAEAPATQNGDAGAAKPKKAKKKGGSLGLWILIALTASALWWAQHAMASY